MSAVFRDRISWKVALWGALFVLIACVFPTKDHFEMDVGGRHRIVTRAGDPLIYWGTESTILVVGMALVGYAIYRNRKKG